ncbi:anthranilate synthase component I family protein [Owenweeksia hongkongensis]|uniref:anthranilate synthase component I family protein n=1 Tax=Owenweeksia hongkongensis TaxID=253245 RepID=UPI003A8E0D8C
MSKIKLQTHHHQHLADTLTPVSCYLKVRDHFPGTFLLESSDYHSREDSFSYICCSPMASFKLENHVLTESFPDGTTSSVNLKPEQDAVQLLQNFVSKFSSNGPTSKLKPGGIFGYMSYESVQHFEDLKLSNPTKENKQIPEIYYKLFRIVIVFDHYKNMIHILEHAPPDEDSTLIETVNQLLKNSSVSSYPFNLKGAEKSNLADDEYLEMVKQGQKHCQLGDVFQMVLSREFQQNFQGDEFNVYRSLRAINPSPYLFYFDFGSFKIFGSSPEAQLKIQGNEVLINPIAGTYKRTGNDEKDRQLALALKEDPKEKSEHIMLVDLARNDLSRHCSNVHLKTYADIQFFSHVIHMVSEVRGQIENPEAHIRVVADTFPAGTLSGAPKYKAMQLIDQIENVQRSFYGGAIGMMDFDGNFNHAILIRSMLSKNNCLTYQAGAGVVVSSQPESELKEVNNKVAALRQALANAEKIQQS